MNYYNKKENKILIFALLSIVLLYPVSTSGVLIYLPQLFLGLVAIYAIMQIRMVKPIKYFLAFGLYMVIMSILLSMMNGSGELSEIFISSIRLFYPFLALLVGRLLTKNISTKSLLYFLVFFLALEFLVGYLQINNVDFRTWSYYLYRSGESADIKLSKFIYSTGQRVIGTIGNPNILGLTVIIINSAILLLSSLINKKVIHKVLCILCTLATTYIVVNTQSRTTILLFVFTIMLLIYCKFTNRNKNKILFFIGASIVMILLLCLLQLGISREISFNALDLRFEIWKVRISQMYDYAVYDNFFASMLGVGFHTARSFGFFDNIYIRYFVSAGAIGLMIYLMTIIESFNALCKMPKNELKLLGLILVLIWIFGSLVTDFQESFKLSTITFILLGYVFSPNRGRCIYK